jgi:hypothetical protein
MTDLADLVESLKREVAIPGTFATVFPTTTDDDPTGALADGVAETQLDERRSRLHLDSLLAVVATSYAIGRLCLVAPIPCIRQRLKSLSNNARF